MDVRVVCQSMWLLCLRPLHVWMGTRGPCILLTLRAVYWTRPALSTLCRDILSQEHSFHLVIKGYEMPHILPWNDQAVRKYGVSEGISVPPPSTAKTEVLPLPSVWACGWQGCLISGWRPERCWHRLRGLMKRLKYISPKKFLSIVLPFEFYVSMY